MTEIDYLRRRCELLQQLRDCALAINDKMRKSEAGDQFTYEGGMNAIELFRDLEAEIVSFDFHHGPDDEEDDS
jgi:hypothetical protein